MGLLEALDPRRTTPWTFVTIAALIGLTAVDQWRELADPCCPVLRGSLPNSLAVPALAFAALGFRFARREQREASRQRAQRRLFRWALAFTVVALLVWEWVQRVHRAGRLVYDPLDLLATLAGAALCIFLFWWLEPVSFSRDRD
ncbi:MAG: hypothetical protein AAFZ58_10990 [Pseudomonadota bacterium]